MNLIDADALEKQLTAEGCNYYGAEYYAYLAGIEYVKNLIEDAEEFDPTYEIYKKLDALYEKLEKYQEGSTRAENIAMGNDYSQARYYQGCLDATAKALVGIAEILEEIKDEID